MQSVALFMWREAVAQGVKLELANEPGVAPLYEPDYSRAFETVRGHAVKAAIIEAAERGAYGMAYCLGVCAQLKREAPACNLLLMCPGQDSEAVRLAVRAKQDNVVDEFVFSEASIGYITSMLLCLVAA
ncbi:MAG: hypothetical protein FWH01_17590 [Oscillospiraceae bacterium]|nr:hypothetical protein [Oscillospiraceae bacterium]